MRCRAPTIKIVQRRNLANDLEEQLGGRKSSHGGIVKVHTLPIIATEFVLIFDTYDRMTKGDGQMRYHVHAMVSEQLLFIHPVST